MTVPGTKASYRANQVVSSSGIVSFDGILGGGMPFGSIVLIESTDFSNDSADLFVRLFMAEGCCFKHANYLVSKHFSELIQVIPSHISKPAVPSSNYGEPPSCDDLKIAWRYDQLPSVDASVGGSTTSDHIFDISVSLPDETAKELIVDVLSDRTDKHIDLVDCLKEKLVSHKTCHRIAIHRFGSCLWLNDSDFVSLRKCFYRLKCLVNNLNSICLITASVDVLTPESISIMRQFSDCVIRLEHFVRDEGLSGGIQSNSEYDGLLKIIKPMSVNTMALSIPECLDIVYKKKRKFVIEKFHLPPDLSETVNRSQQQLGTSCGSSQKLDF